MVEELTAWRRRMWHRIKNKWQALKLLIALRAEQWG